jgi:signal transduction histidine kinase
VNADEIKVTQAFYNLLINAVHYSTAEKNITVVQSVSDGKVKISVIDCCDGITPENLPYVWDRYYKVDKKHRRAIAGTGLGLSIVKKVIDLHGGSYGVESEPGRGSTFWFELRAE